MHDLHAEWSSDEIKLQLVGLLPRVQRRSCQKTYKTYDNHFENDEWSLWFWKENDDSTLCWSSSVGIAWVTNICNPHSWSKLLYHLSSFFVTLFPHETNTSSLSSPLLLSSSSSSLSLSSSLWENLFARTRKVSCWGNPGGSQDIQVAIQRCSTFHRHREDEDQDEDYDEGWWWWSPPSWSIQIFQPIDSIPPNRELIKLIYRSSQWEALV